jgi:vitamin B12 transporter
MNIGTQTTADRTNYRPEDYNQGLSVNGNLDKFNYYAFKQHRDNRNSEAAVTAPAAYGSFFPNKFIDQTGFCQRKKLSLDFCELR